MGISTPTNFHTNPTGGQRRPTILLMECGTPAGNPNFERDCLLEYQIRRFQRTTTNSERVLEGLSLSDRKNTGSNCNIVFESNSTALKSTRTTGGLALQLGATELAKSKAGDVDEIKSLKKTFKNQAEEFIVAHSDSGKA